MKVALLTPQGRARKDQKQGCPQGSCSSPALWNLVTNEILNQVWPDNVHIQAFADDFVLVNTSKIHVDNRASIMASSNSKSTNETARKIFKILLANLRIKVSWVKAHAGSISNERADQLAKDATQHVQLYSLIKLPKPHIRGLLRKSMLEEWQYRQENI
ncbi:hypothetical protein AVEN_10024-1 [Araneus ventricosus]|uniref:Reverse transcriptase domain-containing protein n=1 Tax=Araneus ventricosus TaxID=182803 RepID=A0A4Y2H2X8_ARAVE|nr:hypothetical protein AVEN_10024-1 [Araneus ventricosus]